MGRSPENQKSANPDGSEKAAQDSANNNSDAEAQRLQVAPMEANAMLPLTYPEMGQPTHMS